MRISLTLAALLLVTEALLRLAPEARPPLTVDVGPNTSGYLEGYSESVEYAPVTARFVSWRSILEVPLESSGEEGTLILRCARLRATPLPTRLFLAGREVASFAAQPVRRTLEDWIRGERQGNPFEEFHLQRFRVAFPDGPLRLGMQVEDDERTALSLAVDWVRVEGVRWRVPLSVPAPRLLVAGVFLLALAAGFGLVGATGAGTAMAATVAAWAALDPFGLAHVTSRVALPGLALAGLAALVFRSRLGGRWVVLIALGGYLLKGAGVSYPSAYYPDVLTHSRYLAAFRQADGTLAERGRTAQLAANVAYPRPVGGRMYAFPYSPLFYLPFTLVPQTRAAVEDAMRQVALASAGAEVLVVFWLAGLLFGRTGGVIAALLSACLPVLYSRLLLAMWPTIVGHILDLVAIATVAALAARPELPRRLGAFATALFAALLAYVGSLFNLSAFATALALADRRLAARILAVWAAAVAATVAVLYLPFAMVLAREILPALLASPAHRGSLPSDLGAAFGRIPLFYGYGYPALAVAGMILVRRRLPSAFPLLAAWGLAFLALVCLRGVSLGLFKDLKEILFASPLVALTAGFALEDLAERDRASRWAAAMVVCGLVAFGLARYREYLIPAVSLSGLP